MNLIVIMSAIVGKPFRIVAEVVRGANRYLKMYCQEVKST
jgi:hypothetical protein